MNGFNPEKVVIDTNVVFMALYNPESKAGKIIQYAIEGRIELFSPDTVKEELWRVLGREMKLGEEDINFIINSLPIKWVDKGVYEDYIDDTKVKHKPDKPIEALAQVLNCGVLSADKHFKDRINIDKLLEKITSDF